MKKKKSWVYTGSDSYAGNCYRRRENLKTERSWGVLFFVMCLHHKRDIIFHVFFFCLSSKFSIYTNVSLVFFVLSLIHLSHAGHFFPLKNGKFHNSLRAIFMGPVFIRVRFGVGSSPIAEPKRYERKSKRFQQKSENFSARRAERKVKKKEKKK